MLNEEKSNVQLAQTQKCFRRLNLKLDSLNVQMHSKNYILSKFQKKLHCNFGFSFISQSVSGIE